MPPMVSCNRVHCTHFPATSKTFAIGLELQLKGVKVMTPCRMDLLQEVITSLALPSSLVAPPRSMHIAHTTLDLPVPAGEGAHVQCRLQASLK